MGFGKSGLIIAAIVSQSAWAMPLPALPAWPVWPNWITLRLDVRNLMGPSDAGKLAIEDLRDRVAASNQVWAQCSIRFVPRTTRNVSANELGVVYEPKSQADLSTLAAAINPHGFPSDTEEAIPLTIAGPWRFFDAGSGLYLTGLGWVFTTGQGGIERIGAMMDAQRVHTPIAGLLIAHELAHALSLPHVAEKDNLMGQTGTSKLTAEQCQRARDFSATTLAGFSLK